MSTVTAPTPDVIARRPMLPAPLRVAAKSRETADTWTLELEPGGEFAFAPGQFNMVAAGGHGEVPISISGDPHRPESLVHTVRAVGQATRALCALEPGDVLSSRGPFGRPWPVEDALGRDVVVVSGGIGLAPLRPVVYDVLGRRDDFGRLVVLYGGRAPDQLLYTDELLGWTQDERIDFAITVDAAGQTWRGRVGVVTKLVDRAPLDDPASAVAFVCGPEVMMRFAVSALLQRGLAPENVHVSVERNMQCGIGHCGHCQLGPLLLCRDGPVLPYSQVGHLMGVKEL